MDVKSAAASNVGAGAMDRAKASTAETAGAAARAKDT